MSTSTKIKIVLLAPCLLLVLGLQFICAQLSVTPWQYIQTQTAVMMNPAFTTHGDSRAYAQARIPLKGDLNWIPAPTSNGVVNVCCSSVPAIVNNCWDRVVFCYFQTIVNVPVGTQISRFEVKIGKVDDGARVYLFNSTYPTGYCDPAQDITLTTGASGVTVNLSGKQVVGENRVVIVQFDDCGGGNTINDLDIRVNGNDLPVATVCTPCPSCNAHSLGDPHLQTVDGRAFEFQAAGEFTLLKGECFEIQTRQVPLPGGFYTDPGTGVASCVSLNAAMALKVGNDRITLQPVWTNGVQDRAGMQLKVNGVVQALNPAAISLPSGAQIMPRTAATATFTINIPGGGAIYVTPAWNVNTWYLNITMRSMPGQQGLTGTVGPGQWLPALRNGSRLGTMPTSVADRFNQLYNQFGASWRVDATNSLFDYAPGTSPATYVIAGHPSQTGPCVIAQVAAKTAPAPLPTMTREQATKAAAGVSDAAHKAALIADLMATGDQSFVTAYTQEDRAVPKPKVKGAEVAEPKNGGK